MTAFTYEMVPLCQSRARYFVRRGATTKFNRGFRNKKELDNWFDALHACGALDWRVGNLFRLRGDDLDMEIVGRMQ